MKQICLLSLLITFVAAKAQNDPHLQPVDIFDLEYISDPQISRAGDRVLYVRNFKDIMTDRNLSNIWMVGFNGTQNRPVTSGNQNDRSPRWSPTGDRIVYISNRDESNQIYLKWLDTGDETKLTNLTQSPGGISWSPNGQWIAFTMFVPGENKQLAKLSGKPAKANWNDPPRFIDDMTYRSDGGGYLKQGNRQIFVVSTDGGTPRQITFLENNAGSPQWADNSTLLFQANLNEDRDYNPRNLDLHEVNITSGAVRQLTNRQGVEASPRISPNGQKIAFLGYEDRYQGYQVTRLYTMNRDGSDVKEVSGDFDRDVDNIQWSSDNRGLYFQFTDQGNEKIGFITPNGKVSELTNNVGGLSTGRPYSGGDFSVASNGNYAYTLGSSQHPADLAVGNRKSPSNRLTELNKDLFAFRQLGKVEEVWYKSSHDQKDVQGWICYPPDFDASKKYPLLLEIHGGPFAAYGPWFSFEVQLFAAAGYVVLYTNPRGSTSYGAEFGNAIHHNYPGEDYHDLMSGVDAVIDKGFIDESQLYVTGGSGGGVLTAWIVGNTDRFKAAVVAKPVINWYSFVLYSDGASYHKYWFPGKPWEHQDHYMKRSPISLVGNVTTPTLLLTGEVDYRTPMAETEQYYRALKLQKVETGMVRIPGASHGIAARPSNLMAKVVNILAWFERYSGKED